MPSPTSSAAPSLRPCLPPAHHQPMLAMSSALLANLACSAGHHAVHTIHQCQEARHAASQTTCRPRESNPRLGVASLGPVSLATKSGLPSVRPHCKKTGRANCTPVQRQLAHHLRSREQASNCFAHASNARTNFFPVHSPCNDNARDGALHQQSAHQRSTAKSRPMSTKRHSQ